MSEDQVYIDEATAQKEAERLEREHTELVELFKANELARMTDEQRAQHERMNKPENKNFNAWAFAVLAAGAARRREKELAESLKEKEVQDALTMEAAG